MDQDGFSYMKKVIINGKERGFKCSPTHCSPRFLSEAISKCDEGLKGGITSGWTHILGNKTKQLDLSFIATIEGRRYCSLKNIQTDETEMIFEEQIMYKCCRRRKFCGDTMSMCVEKLHVKNH